MDQIQDGPFSGNDDRLDDAARQFLGALRTRAAAWSSPDAEDTWFTCPDDAKGYRLAVYVGLSDPDPARSVCLVDVGAFFDGVRIRGGEVHNQLGYLDGDAVEPLEVSGTPTALANATADWFEAILRRPLVCLEWLGPDELVRRWLFADTGYELVGEGGLSLG